MRKERNEKADKAFSAIHANRERFSVENLLKHFEMLKYKDAVKVEVLKQEAESK